MYSFTLYIVIGAFGLVNLFTGMLVSEVYPKEGIKLKLLNAHAHNAKHQDAKHLLSFAKFRKYWDPSSPSGSLIILRVPTPNVINYQTCTLAKKIYISAKPGDDQVTDSKNTFVM